MKVCRIDMMVAIVSAVAMERKDSLDLGAPPAVITLLIFGQPLQSQLRGSYTEF